MWVEEEALTLESSQTCAIANEQGEHDKEHRK